MLHGFDLSHHNGANAVNKLITHYPLDSDFFILKATEGKTYVDPYVKTFASDVFDQGKLLGFYHFCRADRGNAPASEAKNFVHVVRPYLGNCLLIADYEGESLKVGQSWLLEWCKEVQLLTGVKPLVYLQYADIKKYSLLPENDFGLWLAKWGTNPDNVSPWYNYALWQYTNRYKGEKLDANRFNGTKDQYLLYCKTDKISLPEDGTCYCGCSCCSN